jgi:hypothetical protein
MSGKTNGDRKDIPEPYKWRCPKCGAKGTAATRSDAELALQVHTALMHGK